MRAQDLDGAEVGEDHDGERDEEGDERRVDGKRPVEDTTLEPISGVKVNCLEDVRPVTYALNDEGNRQGHSHAPRRNDKGRYVASVAGATQVQGIGDAVVTVERDGTQVHDGCRRQDDVTSRPYDADVESEDPLAVHLRTKHN